MFHIVLKMCALHNEQVNISLFQHEIFWLILKVSVRILGGIALLKGSVSDPDSGVFSIRIRIQSLKKVKKCYIVKT